MPHRRRLPDERPAITHRFRIGEHSGYMTVGLFEDGKPGELFITMHKAGSTLNGLLDAVGILTSHALQWGVPLEALVLKLSHLRFEPEGMTDHAEIRYAKSVVDYVFRWMGLRFLQKVETDGAAGESLDALEGNHD